MTAVLEYTKPLEGCGLLCLKTQLRVWPCDNIVLCRQSGYAAYANSLGQTNCYKAGNHLTASFHIFPFPMPYWRVMSASPMAHVQFAKAPCWFHKCTPLTGSTSALGQPSSSNVQGWEEDREDSPLDEDTIQLLDEGRKGPSLWSSV